MKGRIIIVGGDHENTLNVIRSVAEGGYKPIALIISDSKKCFITHSKYLKDYSTFSSEDEVVEYLVNLETGNEKIAIVCTSDSAAATLDGNREKLKGKFFISNCKDKQGGLVVEMDKNKMCESAKKAGFNIPETRAVRLDNYSVECLKDFTFPAIVKPEESIGGLKTDFRVCLNFEELKCALAELSHNVTRVLVQEFIPNDEMSLISGVRSEKGINYHLGLINKVRYGFKTHNLGLNAIGEWSHLTFMKEECNRFLDSIDYHGPYSIEFVTHKGKTYFLEANYRTDVTIYIYSKVGLNIPVIWAESCYQDKVNITLPSKNNQTRGMNEFLYVRLFVRPTKILTNIKDFWRTNVFAIMSIKDPKPLIYKFLNKII